MISHKYKCIFVHIPKTGGSSIENVIWPLKSDRTIENLWMGYVKPYYNKYQTGGMQHLTAEQIRTEIGEDIFKSYYKFAVVRNPWEKAVSQYVYMKRKRKDLRQFIGMRRWTSFKNYLQLIPKRTHVQWMKQMEFLTDGQNNVLVDKVLRFEHLESEFQKVMDHLGIHDTQLPHVNQSKRKHYTKYYDDVSIQMVADFYREDIRRLEYTFDQS